MPKLVYVEVYCTEVGEMWNPRVIRRTWYGYARFFDETMSCCLKPENNEADTLDYCMSWLKERFKRHEQEKLASDPEYADFQRLLGLGEPTCCGHPCASRTAANRPA